MNTTSTYHLQNHLHDLCHNTMMVTMLRYEMLDQHLLLDRECLSRFPNLKNFLVRFDMISITIQIQNDIKGLKSWRPWQLSRSRQSLCLATTLLQLGELSRHLLFFLFFCTLCFCFFLQQYFCQVGPTFKVGIIMKNMREW